LAIFVLPWNQELFGRQKGESDLVQQNGNWFLLATIDLQEPPVKRPVKWLGVDLGEVNIAVDSTGETFTADKIEAKRQKYFKHRQRLQKRNSKSSRRKVRRVGHREARFRRDVNHCISKHLVRKAIGTDSGIALEDLTGIRERTTVRREQRAKRAGWSFWQLRAFLEYKAMQDGVAVCLVNPRNTSRTCSVCGYCSKHNRKSQSQFKCGQCGHAENADLNAAKNIANRAAVNQPIVSPSGGASQRSLVVGC